MKYAVVYEKSSNGWGGSPSDLSVSSVAKVLPLCSRHNGQGTKLSNIGLSIPELVPHFQLIMPDLRGHGRSTTLAKPFRHNEAAEDMLALLDHLRIETCKGLGISGGGNVLLHMAAMQPERIQGMVLVSATPYFPDQAHRIMRGYSQTVPGADPQIRALLASVEAFADSHDDMAFTPPKLATIQARTLIVQGASILCIPSHYPSKWPKPFRTPACGFCPTAVMDP